MTLTGKWRQRRKDRAPVHNYFHTRAMRSLRKNFGNTLREVMSTASAQSHAMLPHAPSRDQG